MEIKINLADNVPFEKEINIHNVVILLQRISNKHHDPYHYHLFEEKYPYKDYINDKCYILLSN